ncbi:Isocitrate dehydrogenase [NAD] subunit, mitochondrial [Meloidogyne graminicola]|uniref:Isocitrate dehydrogenase [NAD] subunit, mitochondrial n=1 Tax=Meloidogyne graminicola TaxID=189291 RepID=A0A8S9ZCW8_9BILA|nr:Isocitrate dehydrogenase [NAD] subunit, mitochondrial [Meloidogyne graminicola]
MFFSSLKFSSTSTSTIKNFYRFKSALTPHSLPKSKTNVILSKNKGRYNVTALPGDGIGPEMLAHVKHIFSAVNIPVDFNDVELNSKDPSDEEFEKAIDAIHKTGAALKGNIETKFDNPDFRSWNMELRRRLDLYANVLHCVSVPSIPAKHSDLDLVLIRENTEGEYSGLEHESVPGIIEGLKLFVWTRSLRDRISLQILSAYNFLFHTNRLLREMKSSKSRLQFLLKGLFADKNCGFSIVTRHGIERIARYAFDYAVLNNRPNITAIHKANIQKLGDGLFLKVCKEIADTEYKSKGLKFDSLIVDNACMQLVSRPQQFNGGILLMPNLYGNIISNIACGLVGGPGLVSGMNIGEKFAVFETGTRNTGTSLTGKDLANPTAFILASIDMLRYLGLDEYADKMSDALFTALTKQKLHTPDIGGSCHSSDIVEAVIELLEK